MMRIRYMEASLSLSLSLSVFLSLPGIVLFFLSCREKQDLPRICLLGFVYLHISLLL